MILLSFDIEEFDMPLEYQGQINFEEQIAISQQGTIAILDILKKYNIKATFFSTVVFAEHSQDIIKRLLAEGHELASHTWYHSDFKNEHLKTSKVRLEELFTTEVVGLRMPRMMPVNETEVADAGYLYNSSVNPTFLPGRYNNLHVKRTYFVKDKVLQLPASVSPLLRVPLFWLSFHNFPVGLYRFFAKRCINNTKYLNVYFHPWEFCNLTNPDFKLPGFTIKNTDDKMKNRFEEFIKWSLKNNYTFGRTVDFVKSIKA